ncbi:CPBP family intramembrane glutamic endopeptidase [Streptomyces mayonensis]|uniref:CPBP family intramembrane glutamic endopeptidase n=1 Tax=Streptomyces mayonensis TaxID=2750816 RepID=UPI001C1E3353|nr:CPBP family intramembrane glutamic endopeptidase [Streptomyces sp. A108]MBU6530746.1 CPBP family intramembrane metalloprotease [Streptomyces sp. A108]
MTDLRAPTNEGTAVRTGPGPLPAVLVVAVCLAVGQGIGWLVVNRSGVERASHAGLVVQCFAAFVPTLALIGVWTTVRERRPFSSLGFAGPGAARKALLGAGAAVVALLVLNIGAGAVGGGARDAGQGSPAALGTAVLLLVAFTVQASTEEVLFRGFLLPRTTARWGVTAGVLGSSLLFACAHLANPDAPAAYILMTFMLGCALALWALADGALWRTCAFHTVWNFLPNVTADGSDENASADFDGATLGVAVVVLAAVIAYAFRSYRRSLTTRG